MKKNIAGRLCGYAFRGTLMIPLLVAAAVAALISFPFLLKKRGPFR